MTDPETTARNLLYQLVAAIIDDVLSTNP